MVVKTAEGYLSPYEPVLVFVDAVLFTMKPGVSGKNMELAVILFRRTDPAEPDFGRWALPGGSLRADSDADDEAACLRVIRQKLDFDPGYLEQLRTFCGKYRDSRGFSCTIAHFALVRWSRIEAWLAKKSSDDFMVVGVDADHPVLDHLAFDHGKIVSAAVERLRAKSSYSDIAARLLDEKFTLPELHAVYEAIRNEKENASAFRRKVLLDPKRRFIEEVPNEFRGVTRQAQLYRLIDQDHAQLFERML